MTQAESWNSDAFLQALAGKGKHDLGAGVRRVRSFSELLEEELKDSLSDDSRVYLDFIKQAGDQMGLIIQRVAQLIRLDDQECNHQVVRLGPLFAAYHSDLTIASAVAELEVLVDTRLLGVALEEIVQNAFRYGAAPIRIELPSPGQIRICDAGSGIESEKMAEAMQPFRRMVPSTHSPGAGLGFSLASRAIELMGGRLELSVSEAGGLRVSLHLSS